jgi:hypothetical protein
MTAKWLDSRHAKSVGSERGEVHQLHSPRFRIHQLAKRPGSHRDACASLLLRWYLKFRLPPGDSFFRVIPIP